MKARGRPRSRTTALLLGRRWGRRRGALLARLALVVHQALPHKVPRGDTGGYSRSVLCVTHLPRHHALLTRVTSSSSRYTSQELGNRKRGLAPERSALAQRRRVGLGTSCLTLPGQPHHLRPSGLRAGWETSTENLSTALHSAQQLGAQSE